MSPATRFRNLPLRMQLVLVFAFLSIATTAISTVTLTSLAERRMHAELTVKSAHYTQQLRQQLEHVLQPDSRLTARELFASLSGDKDVDGLGVYLADGELIEGRGDLPDRLTAAAIAAAGAPGQDHVVTIADLEIRGGLAARLYVSLATAPIEAQHRHDIWIAGGVAAIVVLGAMALAAYLSRRIARRLVEIAEAANRMASGDLAEARLDERSQDEIGALAHAFNVMVSELHRVSAEHERLVATERERLEALVSERTQALEQSRELYRLIVESTLSIPFTLDLARGCFPYIGTQGVEKSGLSMEAWQADGALDVIIPRDTNSVIRERLDDCEDGPFEFEAPLVRLNRERMEIRWAGTCEVKGGVKVLRGLMQDVTELRRLERELTAAQKLESVGRLAAGVAHEINTPLQFITDNVHFVRTSMDDLSAVVGAYRNLNLAIESGGDVAGAAAAARRAEQAADFDFLAVNTPLAIGGALEGLGKITTIVRSMKEFAHPDQAQKTFEDLNQAITSTLVISRHEYKYVAELTTDFGDLPPVECHLGEINQVVLNLLVNAAHAIGDVVKDSGQMGKLTVRTRQVDGDVEISIGDTGGGIPESDREKIFDPFFTTKAVGKGTGQGLAIARSVVVNKHAGTLRFETENGVGTTFFIRIPVCSPERETADRAVA